MKKRDICNLLILISTTLLALFPTVTYSQHRIPNKGENIQFCPIVKEQRKIHTGYDCFYTENLVSKNGSYKFKKKYRFKIGKDKLTPLKEIEDYTFYVRDIKGISVMNLREMLIFLTRNEDGEKIIMRLKLDSSKGNNFLSNAMFEYKKVYNGWSFVYAIDRINLSYINSDSLNIYKERYSQQNIVYSPSYNSNSKDKTETLFNDLVEITNQEKHYFYKESRYYVMGMGFREAFKEALTCVPCAVLRSESGKFVYIPLCYFSIPTVQTIYTLPRLFMTEEAFNKKELAQYDLQPLIDEYMGKDVYYGLDNTLTDEKQKHVKITTAVNINEVYKLTEGRYKSVDFVVNSDVEMGLLARKSVKKYPYAILEDSLGIKFKVRINDEDYTDNKKNSFEKYFTHANIADSIIAERERIKFENALIQMKRLMDLEKEFGKDTGFLLFGCSDEEVDRFRGLKKEFGEKYGLYLIKRSDENVDRFRRLKKKYGALNAIAILSNGYAIGWTEDMIRESLGIPYDINRSVGSWGVHEQWIYRMDYKTIYIHFENGKVRSFQD